jgi:GNAT superfamily N-acetyltransferase
MYEIEVEADSNSLADLVRQGIRESDPIGVRPRDWQTVTLALRGTDGKVVGGLYGATMWSWLMIEGLWVAEGLRGQGLGGRLLAFGEEIARNRGCVGARLGTFEFQARRFYERHGYSVFATLPGFPPGYTHFHLQKLLAEQS